MENATYIPPEPQLVSGYISNLEKYINENKDDLPLIKWHYFILNTKQYIHLLMEMEEREGY